MKNKLSRIKKIGKTDFMGLFAYSLVFKAAKGNALLLV
jgi:hypothetical protein